MLACSDRLESRYDDLEAARRGGLVTPDGQFARVLPGSAKDIRRVFNMDTGSSWVDFSFAPADLSTMQVGCRLTDRSSVQLPSWQPSHWPRLNREETAASDVLMRCAPGEFMFIDDQNHRAYFWYSPD
jgi:hypothetical protein